MFQSSTRNVTGSFLGKDSGGESTTTRLSASLNTPKIRPLQTGRGRYARTTTEVNRHKKVEAIREKESYRGFSGRQLSVSQRPKTSPCASLNVKKTHDEDVTPSAEDIKALTRRNARQFTAVNNHGVVHREYLTYPPVSKAPSASIRLPPELSTALALTAAADGLIQNESALRNLSPGRSVWPTNQYTGFYIRGYKKPPTAQILADLPQSQQRRPKTAATFGSNRELLVPQPYIYSGSPNIAKRVGLKLTPPSQQPPSQPIAFAGKKANLSPQTSFYIQPSTKMGAPQPPAYSDEVVDMYSSGKEVNCGQSVCQLEPGKEDSTSRLLGTFEHAMPIMKKTLATKDESDQLPGDVGSTPKINIALETDDGDVRAPEIDDVEELFEENQETDNSDSPARRLSITERIQKIKLGEDYANSVKIEAERRKKALEDLLEEHEHLVRQIVSADRKSDTISH